MLDWIKRKRNTVKAGCGHITELKGELYLELNDLIISDYFCAKSKKPDLCINCYIKKIIRCSKCGRAIFPGDTIGVYRTHKKLPQYSIKYPNSKNAYIVCVRESCIKNNILDKYYFLDYKENSLVTIKSTTHVYMLKNHAKKNRL